MDSLPELLNFFGNPDLDRHRLLQGKWKTYRLDWDDPEAQTDKPLEALLNMLMEELSNRKTSDQPAVRALYALTSTALEYCSSSEFSNIKRDFWHGFQFVAQSAATELGVVFKDINHDDVRHIIENRYP